MKGYLSLVIEQEPAVEGKDFRSDEYYGKKVNRNKSIYHYNMEMYLDILDGDAHLIGSTIATVRPSSNNADKAFYHQIYRKKGKLCSKLNIKENLQ